MMIANEEHHEARQAAADRRKEEVLSRMLPENREKLLLVEKYVEELTDAGIIFFMLAYINDPAHRGTMQYNSIGKNVGFNDDGSQKDEGKVVMVSMIQGIHNSFSCFCRNQRDWFVRHFLEVPSS